jgi:hypothetical protein
LQPNDYQPLALSNDQRPACRDFVASEVPEVAGLPGVSPFLRKWPIEFQCGNRDRLWRRLVRMALEEAPMVETGVSLSVVPLPKKYFAELE